MTVKRSICFIPSGEMLRLHPVDHWLRRFAEFTQRNATEIVLPAVGLSGPLFSSAVSPVPKTYDRSNLLPQWIQASREVMGEDAVIWGNIVVELGFMQNEALWLIDQFGDPLSQVCMVNPAVQGIIGDLVTEMLDHGVDGVVLDITDAYPNSSAEGRVGFSMHCYCDYCMDSLRNRGFREPREVFFTEPLLGQLVLNKTDSGVGHIDPPQEWLDSRDTTNLMALAVARQFVNEEADGLQAAALRLLSYMRARVAVTADAVRAVLSPARAASKRTAVVLGDYKADLSQLVTLPALNSAKSADEYWLPFVPDRSKVPGDWRAIQFLAGRSTYYFNAFFEVVEGASLRMVLRGPQDFLGDLLRTSKALMNNYLGAGAVFATGKFEHFEGFAGVPLNQDDHIELVDELTRTITGDVLPPELLERFRIETADRPGD
ncbi:hypothetical protein [Streptosporangium sp. NPDC004631]